MEKTMKRVVVLALGALLLTSVAHAQVVMNSARIGAMDSAKLAMFYQTAFGMQEVRRIAVGANPEIFLNFGATVDAAKANTALPLVIMHRDSDDLKDPVPHIIFNVKDMKATVAAVKAAGGSMQREPFAFGGANGPQIGIAQDPVGNLIELIEMK
jgi:predicted enzyme related to lactoylglutathione lyase